MRISPADGRVLGWIDLAGLLTPEDRAEPVDVLNGIAYDVLGDRLFFTGKLWPKLFELKIIPKTTRGKAAPASTKKAASSIPQAR